MTDEKKPGGPDLALGVSLSDFRDGKLLGHVGEDEVLLVQLGAEVLAIDSYCTHYHGPLAEGLVVDDTVRCPWHHAWFSLKTGKALAAPAIDPVACWTVEEKDGRARVTAKAAPAPIAKASKGVPRRVVIV